MHHGFPAALSVPELYGSSMLTWVLVGLGLYWIGVLTLRNAGLLPDYIGTQGPILTFHTKRGRDLLDWLATPKRFWRAWANLGIGIALVVMVSMFVFLIVAAIAALSSPQPSSVQQPRNVLMIPGVNDFLPLSATPGIVFGLLVGLVVHEGGHGLLCRVEDIDIESMGVAMLAILPVGAFVEPDQESSKNASRGGQTRMFAAGVTNNFAVTVLAFAFLFGPIAGSIAVAPGAAVGGVAPNSPAADAGIQPNDRITAIDGTPVESNDDLKKQLEADNDGQIAVELNGGEQTVQVDRSVLVTAAMDGGPTGLKTGDEIVAVNGQSVATERGFLKAVGDDAVVTLTIDQAHSDKQVKRDVPIGAAVKTIDNGPLADATGAAGESFVITSFEGERIHTYDDLQQRLENSEAGETVSVTGYADGNRKKVTVTLGDHPRADSGFLGIRGYSGTSGISVNDLGVQLYPAEEYLVILGGSGDGSFTAVTDSFLGKIGLVLMLPIVGITGTLPFNFAGFAGGIENFYEVEGALAAMGDGTIFLMANLLFWTGWINVQLGFFNCVPAFPLDGGHILRTSTEAIVSRLPINATRGMVRVVTTSVGLLMLISFLVMLFGPQLLS